jgi:hypothetical protein
MRYAVMQPTFLPWAGYFRLAAFVDYFVFLDDVQLSRQSWQTRNRILVDGEVHWLSVPIGHDRLDQRINETKIADSAGRWRRKVARLLQQSYARARFKSDLADLIVALETAPQETLADFNIALAAKIMSLFGIQASILRSSGMGLTQAERTDRLIEIGTKLCCDTYISPIGSRGYLETDAFASRTTMRLTYLAQDPPAYDQGSTKGFVPRLSIVDGVANLGWRGAGNYVRGEWIAANLPGIEILC